MFIKSRSILSRRGDADAMILWHDERSALVFSHKGGHFHLSLALCEPLVPLRLETPQGTDIDRLPVRDSLEQYERDVRAWFDEDWHWWFNTAEGRFTVKTEQFDDEGNLIAELPLRVRIGDQVLGCRLGLDVQWKALSADTFPQNYPEHVRVLGRNLLQGISTISGVRC